MKHLAWLASLVSVSFLAQAAAAAIKLGYVDMQRAVKEVDAGKRAFKKLRRLYNKYQRQIRKKEKALKAFQEEVKKQSLVLTEEAKKQKAAELQRMFLEFQNTYMEKQKALQKRESKLMGPIIAKLMKIIRQMGMDGDYTMIVERTEGRVLFAQESLDLTNELIRRYNEGSK